MSWCLPENKNTPNVPGSEKIVLMKNGQKRVASVCASCGRKKSSLKLPPGVSNAPKQKAQASRKSRAKKK